jgi:aerobic C4-dicarboxylate transport protein
MNKKNLKCDYTMMFSGLFKKLYMQVFIGIILGVLVGVLYPSIAVNLAPLGNGFISLIKMLIPPIIFGTLVVGIVGMKDLKGLGKLGVKSLVYFEVMSTIALIIGLLMTIFIQPGAGFNANLNGLSHTPVSNGTPLNGVNFILNIIPTTIFSGFVEGNILQVLLVSILFSIGLLKLGESGKPVYDLIDKITKIFYEIIGMITKLAPIGAFGAISFAISTYGVESTSKLLYLIGTVAFINVLFIIVCLGIVAKICGFNIFKLIVYIKDEIILAVGTNSSELVLPKIITKLENLGCNKSIVGFVIPTCYSFNLDGTSIYLTISTIFILQAFNVHITLIELLTIFGVLLITSKGAAAVSGGGFIILSATLSMFSMIPVEAFALIFSVDFILSEFRTFTNLMGDSIATIFIAKWEGLLDKDKLNTELNS